MRLSTKTRYAARAMAELGSVKNGGSLSVREVAERQHLSAKYLENIFQVLSSAGLLAVIRGKHGGFRLAKPAQNISLREVFEALEGSLAPVDCVDDPRRCSMADTCPTRDTWVELHESLLSVLERTTIHQLAEKKLARASAATFDYQI